MLSPFRRHQQHVRALQSGAAAAPAPAPAAPEQRTDTPQGQEYAALRVLLHDNLRSLSDIASIEARNPRKAEFARAFAPWIEGVLEAGRHGQAAQDEILVTNLIWAVDYRDWDYAMALADHAITHHLALPERYNRTLPCWLAEDIATIANDMKDVVPHDVLCRVLALVEDHDMPDPAKAKLHKALGRSFARKADAFDPAADNAPAGGKPAYLTAALEQLRRAWQLDSSCGVKTDIKGIEKALRTQGPGDGPAGDEA